MANFFSRLVNRGKKQEPEKPRGEEKSLEELKKIMERHDYANVKLLRETKDTVVLRGVDTLEVEFYQDDFTIDKVTGKILSKKVVPFE